MIFGASRSRGGGLRAFRPAALPRATSYNPSGIFTVVGFATISLPLAPKRQYDNTPSPFPLHFYDKVPLLAHPRSRWGRFFLQTLIPGCRLRALHALRLNPGLIIRNP